MKSKGYANIKDLTPKKIAVLSPVAWRTPPRHYGPWENVVSLLTEGLVKRGFDTTLFATADSITDAKLKSVCARGYEEDKSIEPKVWECLHISELFEHADEFDLIHNNFDYLPLTYSGLTETPVITTIHGFSSPKIHPVYEKYNGRVSYVSISNADRIDSLDYISTVYHGINLDGFTFNPDSGGYLLFFSRIHPDKGAREAVEIAKKAGMELIMAGIIQDRDYFEKEVKPHIDNKQIKYAGSVAPPERNKLLGGAYALLHPINFKEPFGLSVVESMACGTPVIAFNKGSMPEIVEHGRSGFLVNNASEAADAVKDIGSIDRRVCREIVEKRFTADIMVDNYIKVYKKVLALKAREDHRPWGYYTILSDNDDHKVKRIVVYPGKRLSLQRHRQRTEHWHIINGRAVVTINDRTIELSQGESIDIPKHALHRIENKDSEDMAFIEIQQGEYFGEDDIERIEDDFGRV